jgi:hypothetical protein
VGGAEKFVDDGDNTYGGKWSPTPGWPVEQGHPLKLPGLAQFELTHQLRGTAEQRQVQQGAPCAAAQPAWAVRVVTLYEKSLKRTICVRSTSTE